MRSKTVKQAAVKLASEETWFLERYARYRQIWTSTKEPNKSGALLSLVERWLEQGMEISVVYPAATKPTENLTLRLTAESLAKIEAILEKYPGSNMSNFVRGIVQLNMLLDYREVALYGRPFSEAPQHPLYKMF